MGEEQTVVGSTAPSGGTEASKNADVAQGHVNPNAHLFSHLNKDQEAAKETETPKESSDLAQGHVNPNAHLFSHLNKDKADKAEPLNEAAAEKPKSDTQNNTSTDAPALTSEDKAPAPEPTAEAVQADETAPSTAASTKVAFKLEEDLPMIPEVESLYPKVDVRPMTPPPSSCPSTAMAPKVDARTFEYPYTRCRP